MNWTLESGSLKVDGPTTDRQKNIPMSSLARLMPQLALLAALALPGLAEAQLYRWVDEDGQVHYSDTLPPERASDERRVFSRGGRAVRDVERAPTREELRALEQARQRAAEAEAEAEEQRRQQQTYDRMLTATYESVEQLENTREKRIEQLREQRAESVTRQEQYEREITRLRQDAARAERRGASNLGAIYQQIDRTREQLTDERSYAEAQDREIKRIREEFSEHIARFRELKDTN